MAWGGGLTQLLLLGETSRQARSPNSAAADALGRQVCVQSRELLQEMNEAVWLINSQRDTIHDFASYVARYAEIFFRTSAIRCRLEVQEDLTALLCDLGVRRNLFLAVKEALNNVLRHSKGTVVHVEIRRQHQELTVTIRDDGCGFDASVVSRGNGLRSMQTRAAEADTRFTVESSVGNGCRVVFGLPLAPDSLRLSWWFPGLRRRKMMAQPPRSAAK